MLSHVNTANQWTQVSRTSSECLLSPLVVLKPHPEHLFQCLCIAPTYELALQIGQVIEQMGKFLPDVKLAYAVRGNRSKSLTGSRGVGVFSDAVYVVAFSVFSGARREAAGTHRHRNAGHRPRLVHQVQTHRPQEGFSVCTG